MPFLLERLSVRPAAPDGRQEAFDESAAIQAQIQRIFYTRNQSDSGSAAVIGWGLPNIVEIGSHDKLALTRYAEQARLAILQHEPRLKEVTVTVMPQANALVPSSLLVSGMLANSGESMRFNLALPD